MVLGTLLVQAVLSREDEIVVLGQDLHVDGVQI